MQFIWLRRTRYVIRGIDVSNLRRSISEAGLLSGARHGAGGFDFKLDFDRSSGTEVDRSARGFKSERGRQLRRPYACSDSLRALCSASRSH